jgi:histone deacetylase 1/2
MHKRFGHANIESIVKGLKDQTIKGYDVSIKRGRSGKYELLNGKCDCCMYSKHHLPSFPNASTVKGSGPGKYVVCDIQGPFSIESMGGERYVLTYTDYYTRYSWTYLLHQKSEAFKHLKHLVEVVFKAARVELRHYHSDGAGELTSKETTDYLQRTVGATISTSEAYTPQRNAIAERKFRTLGEMAKAMLYDSSLPKNFWGYAYLNATYLRNRIPITTCDGITKTPYELWTGQTSNIRH